jgi:site-specific DNA-cytosine methylase
MIYREHGGKRPDFLDRPAPTVTCQEVRGTRASASSGWRYSGGPDRLSDALFAACGVRRASVEDCSLIQGFPKDWKWVGTVTEQYRMVGNAVPPPVAKAIGEKIKEVLYALS